MNGSKPIVPNIATVFVISEIFAQPAKIKMPPIIKRVIKSAMSARSADDILCVIDFNFNTPHANSARRKCGRTRTPGVFKYEAKM